MHPFLTEERVKEEIIDGYHCLYEVMKAENNDVSFNEITARFKILVGQAIIFAENDDYDFSDCDVIICGNGNDQE